MRGRSCATSTKASRTSRPTRSSSAVLCLAVRAGQLSSRRKMTVNTAPPIRKTSVSASGQENFRCGSRDAAFIDMGPKKYRPPRPMDMKGGCSPQNIFKSVHLITKLSPDGKKNCYDLLRRGVGTAITCLNETRASLSDDL